MCFDKVVVEQIVVVIGFALLHWYALTEEKHTSFYTKHKKVVQECYCSLGTF